MSAERAYGPRARDLGPGAGIVVATPTAPGEYRFTLREIRRRLHPQLPKTPVWAYDDGSGLGGQAGSFGMAIAAQTGTPVQVSYTHCHIVEHEDNDMMQSFTVLPH